MTSTDMFDDNGILITGPARSGLSIVAGLIDIGGAFGGDVTKHPYYRRPNFLNKGILHEIIKPLMIELGVDPRGQDPLPDIDRCRECSAELGHKIAVKIEATMIVQGYKDGPWYYHGAKACLIWPIWHAAFPKAKIVVVRRELEAHLKALRAAHYMRHIDRATLLSHKRTDEFWLKWIAEHEKRLDEMQECETLDMKVVWPDKAIAGDYSEMQTMIEWLGLEWNEKKARELWKR